MSLFQTRLFFRIIAKSREAYFLKIITLAIAFACTTLILLFSINEFGYDRFHREYNSIFRILQRNNNESFIGNRFSNKVPFDVINVLKSINSDSLITSRVKLLDKVNVQTGDKYFSDSKLYAADPDIVQIFSFEILNGSLKEFQEKERTVILSSSAANKYFGTNQSQGKQIRISTFSDTLLFTVAAIYKDYPQNSHEEFNSFIRFDNSSLQSLNFNPKSAGIYGKLLRGKMTSFESIFNK